MDEQERVRYYMDIMSATLERTIKRLWILCIALVVLLVATNAAWLLYESQFESVEVTQEVEQSADSGENRFIGGDYYGDAAD